LIHFYKREATCENESFSIRGTLGTIVFGPSSADLSVKQDIGVNMSFVLSMAMALSLTLFSNIVIFFYYNEKVFDLSFSPIMFGQEDNFPIVAIVAPYRDRPLQLWTFLEFFRNFLETKDGVRHRIYIVNQTDSLPFNRECCSMLALLRL